MTLKQNEIFAVAILMKILAENYIELDAEVSLGNHEGFFGLFLESRSGSPLKNPRNSDYFEALEAILKRLYTANIKEIRVFLCSKNLISWNLEDREILLKGQERIYLSSEISTLRKAICNAQAKVKENPKSKGGNPTKRIFITGNIDESLWNAIIHNNFSFSEEFDEEDIEPIFWEGKEVLKLHTVKERNKVLVNQAKKERAKSDPLLHCQICGFSFIEKYGEMGRGFIEAHHSLPLSELKMETQVSISDLIMVCSNCHRMLHQARPWISVEGLKSKIQK